MTHHLLLPMNINKKSIIFIENKQLKNNFKI